MLDFCKRPFNSPISAGLFIALLTLYAMTEPYWQQIWNNTDMHMDSSCFLLQPLQIISINWLSHPATFNPTLPSSQFQCGIKEDISPSHNLVCVCSTGSAPLLIKQLLVFPVTHQIFEHHIKFPRIPVSPEVVNPSSSIDHRRGACLHWSPTGLIHFIHFIKSIFSRIVKAMWAEQKKNRPWRTEIPALRHVVLLLWLKRLLSGGKGLL